MSNTKPSPYPSTIVVAGAKGGVGTTTVAATLAALARGTLTVAGLEPRYLDAWGLEMDPEIRSGPLASTPEAPLSLGGDGYVVARMGGSDPAGPIVMDAGCYDEAIERVGRVDVLVTTACYLALKRMVRHGRIDVAAVVLRTETGRALTEGDVRNVLGVQSPIVEIPTDPAVARAVDAGLVASRLPRTLQHRLHRILPPHQEAAA